LRFVLCRVGRAAAGRVQEEGQNNGEDEVTT